MNELLGLVKLRKWCKSFGNVKIQYEWSFLYWFWTPSLLLYTTPHQETIDIRTKVLLHHNHIEHNTLKKTFWKDNSTGSHSSFMMGEHAGCQCSVLYNWRQILPASLTFIYNQTLSLFFSSFPPCSNTPTLLCSPLLPLVTPSSCHYSWLPFIFAPFSFLHTSVIYAPLSVCECLVLFPLVPQPVEVSGTLQLARLCLYSVIFMHVYTCMCVGP